MIKLNRRIVKELGLKVSDMCQISYRSNDKRDGIKLTYDNMPTEVGWNKLLRVVKREVERLAKELKMEPYEKTNLELVNEIASKVLSTTEGHE